MIDKMFVFHVSGTWELVPLPPGKSIIGCPWVYVAKVGQDDQVVRLKLTLLLMGILRYLGFITMILSLVAKIAFVCLFLSMVVVLHWPFYPLDIKNVSHLVTLQRKFIWSNHLVCC